MTKLIKPYGELAPIEASGYKTTAMKAAIIPRPFLGKPPNGFPARLGCYAAFLLIGLAGPLVLVASARPGNSQSGGGALSASPVLSNATYRVHTGDGAYRIAKRFATTIPLLQAANPGVDLSRLKPGQELGLPPAPVARNAHLEETPKNSLNRATVTVGSGDTAAAVAKRFGVTDQQLQAANSCVDLTRLQAGQVLLIPGQGWRCQERTNSTFSATHQQLRLTVELVNESGTPRLLSWQRERNQLWSLTYYAGSPGTHFTCDVIRKALINVRTGKVLADVVLRYEHPQGAGQLPAAPIWTWTPNALIIRDPEAGGDPVTISSSGMN